MANEQRSPGGGQEVMLWGIQQGWRLWEGSKEDAALPRVFRCPEPCHHPTELSVWSSLSSPSCRQELQGGKGDGPSHKGGQRSWVGLDPGAVLAWAAEPLGPRQQFCGGVGLGSHSDPSSATLWEKCQGASVTHTAATMACVL